MSENVSKDRENLLRTTIALVGGEIRHYPLPGAPKPIVAWEVFSDKAPLTAISVFGRTEIEAMEEFCKINELFP